MITKAEFIKKFLKDNPDIKEDQLNLRADGRVEWICEHGVGHTIYSRNNHYEHGCDGCCKNIKFERLS